MYYNTCKHAHVPTYVKYREVWGEEKKGGGRKGDDIRWIEM